MWHNYCEKPIIIINFSTVTTTSVLNLYRNYYVYTKYSFLIACHYWRILNGGVQKIEKELSKGATVPQTYLQPPV